MVADAVVLYYAVLAAVMERGVVNSAKRVGKLRAFFSGITTRREPLGDLAGIEPGDLQRLPVAGGRAAAGDCHTRTKEHSLYGLA